MTEQCATCRFYGIKAYRRNILIGRTCKRDGIVHDVNDVCEQWEVLQDG